MCAFFFASFTRAVKFLQNIMYIAGLSSLSIDRQTHTRTHTYYFPSNKLIEKFIIYCCFFNFFVVKECWGLYNNNMLLWKNHRMDDDEEERKEKKKWDKIYEDRQNLNNLSIELHAWKSLPKHIIYATFWMSRFFFLLFAFWVDKRIYFIFFCVLRRWETEKKAANQQQLRNYTAKKNKKKTSSLASIRNIHNNIFFNWKNKMHCNEENLNSNSCYCVSFTRSLIFLYFAQLIA